MDWNVYTRIANEITRKILSYFASCLYVDYGRWWTRVAKFHPPLHLWCRDSTQRLLSFTSSLRFAWSSVLLRFPFTDNRTIIAFREEVSRLLQMKDRLQFPISAWDSVVYIQSRCCMLRKNYPEPYHHEALSLLLSDENTSVSILRGVAKPLFLHQSEPVALIIIICILEQPLLHTSGIKPLSITRK